MINSSSTVKLTEPKCKHHQNKYREEKRVDHTIGIQIGPYFVDHLGKFHQVF